jgi:hypothetical protein
MNLQEQISRIQSMMGINESSETTDDVVGKEFWFEYHCFESPKSCDAELWYRTHNKVLVLSIVELGCGETKLERLLEGCPRVYRVVFEDGFEYDVFEDELMESKEKFERPDVPKRNLQEHIRKVLKEELKTKFFLRRVTPEEVAKYFSLFDDQIFFETETYEEFRYQLVLKSLEHVMWQEYNMGWEELPEQEEIEYVNQIAEMYDDILLVLYNRFYNR